MKTGIVKRLTDGLFNYQGWPTVCRDDKGILYVGCSSFRLGHLCPFGKNVMYVSSDEAKTWSPPIVIHDTALDNRDVGLTYLGGEKILMTSFSHSKTFYMEGELFDWADKKTNPIVHDMAVGLINGWKNLPESQNNFGSFVKLSLDRGKTWGEPVKIPVTSPHGPTLLKNGKLLFLGKEFHSKDYEHGAIYAFGSDDFGKTWNYMSKLDFPDFCDQKNVCEPCAVELPNGRIIGMIRGIRKPVDFELSSFICHSDDGGFTWSKPMATGFCGSPPHLLVHSSGALVLTYGRRHEPFGQRARVSFDNGDTFGNEIIISDFSNSGDLGYPSSVELSDGSILTVYYQRYENDRYPSILYTKWELPNK